MTAPVPPWVHMADVPPADAEPWAVPEPEIVVPRWAGWLPVAAVVLLALAAIDRAGEG